MPEPRKKLHRFEGHGHARFLTFSCYRRLPLFQNDRIKDAFVEHLAAVQWAIGFQLYAWVVMPEHVHLLLHPAGHATVETILRKLKTPFARRTLQRWRQLDAPVLDRLRDKAGRTRFWQHGGGYDRNIHSDDEFNEKGRYTDLNPVKRGLVTRAIDYRWSSTAKRAGLTVAGPDLAPFGYRGSARGE